MDTIPAVAQVHWVTDLPAALIRAEHDLFSRLYPGFVRDVTAHFDRFEQAAFTLDAGGSVLSAAGSRRRFVAVGGTEIVISGVGGVMTDPDARMQGSGRQTLTALAATFRSGGRCESDFGFVQCRAEIAPFYEAVGWTRVDNHVLHIDERDARTPVTSGGPTLVVPGRRPIGDWPSGMVDLRGLPW